MQHNSMHRHLVSLMTHINASLLFNQEKSNIVQNCLLFLFIFKTNEFSTAFQEAPVFWPYSFSHLLLVMGLWLYFFHWYVYFFFFLVFSLFLRSSSGIIFLCIFLFPLMMLYFMNQCYFFQFVLTATGSKAEQEIYFDKSKWRGSRMGRLPIFYIADKVS